jgi:hypothetical protein
MALSVGGHPRRKAGGVNDLAFFRDPAVDRVLGVVLELAGEVYVLRERVRSLEQALERGGTLRRVDIERLHSDPTPEERALQLAERDALIARILAPMADQADSPAPPFEPA